MANILMLMSGSIACFKGCSALSLLVQEGHRVKVATTKSALNFVGRATLEGLSQNDVSIDLFSPGKMMEHIHLNRWCDLMLLCPASAQTLNAMAQGLADTLPQALALAHDYKKPFLIAPAMNTHMLTHPATQNSLRTLQEWGAKIVMPSAGRLACGEKGAGRLVEPEQIIFAVEKALAPRGLKVLITGGGTEEPIDAVRAITNQSTGKTAATIADCLIQKGHDVTYLHGKRATIPVRECKKISFTSSQNLSALLASELSAGFDVVIHAAAVSDYTVHPFQGKLKSSNHLTLNLEPTEKLIDKIREWNSSACVVIGFKLTATSHQDDREEAVKNLKIRSQVDVVVHNDLLEMTKDKHPFTIFGDQVVKVEGEQALGERIASCYLQSTLVTH